MPTEIRRSADDWTPERLVADDACKAEVTQLHLDTNHLRFDVKLTGTSLSSSTTFTRKKPMGGISGMNFHGPDRLIVMQTNNSVTVPRQTKCTDFNRGKSPAILILSSLNEFFVSAAIWVKFPILPVYIFPFFPVNSGPCNSLNCLGHFAHVYDDDDD